MGKSSTIFFFVFVLALSSVSMLSATAEDGKSGVYIVLLGTPSNKDGHIRILTPVLGSEKAAREALVYNYKFGGFAAKLTPKQASQISRVPGVVGVLPNRNYYLEGPVATFA